MLLMWLLEPAEPPSPSFYQQALHIDPFGVNFSINGANVNHRIRLVEDFSIDYHLLHRSTMRCVAIDTSEDQANAYRPQEEQNIVVTTLAGAPIFSGRILSIGNRTFAENVGVATDIDAVGYERAAEHRFITETFGTDPMALSSVGVGNPALVTMHQPHGLATGNIVTLADVIGTTPDVNTSHVVTVLNATQFTIPINVTVAGGAGSARQRWYLRDIIDELMVLLAAHGIERDPGMALGPLLEKQTFDGSVWDAITHLSKTTGWPFRFLPTRIFQMFEAGTLDATFEVNGDNIIGSPRWQRTRSGYANTIVLKYGSSIVAEKQDFFVGNGTQRVFPLKYIPGTAGANASPGHIYYPSTGGFYHVGVYGVDTLFEWVYRESDNTIVQLSEWAGQVGWPAPASGFQFSFVYNVQFPQTVIFPSPPPSEPFEKVVVAPTIFEKETAQQYAQSALLTANAAPRRVSVALRETLLFPGVTLPVNVADQLLNGGEWLVQSMSVREDPDGAFRSSFDLLEGTTLQPNWIDFFKDMAGGGGGASSSMISAAALPPSGGGGAIGTGTTGRLALWTSTATLGDAAISDVGGVLTILPLGNAVLSPGGTVALNPTGDVVLNPVSNLVRPSANYDINLGSLDKKYLTLHAAELWVETLVAQDTIATIGGRILVGPTTTLVLDLAPADVTIHVKYNNLANGDRVYMEASGKIEFMAITSVASGGAGDYTYSVTRNLDGSGANQWFAGDALFNTGQTGSGFIDLYSIRGIKSAAELGPTIVGNVRNSNTFNDWSPRWAIGNLNGLYGYATNIYGLALGVPTAAWVKIDPTNGVRVGHNVTTFMQITAAGAASFTGSVTVTGGNALVTGGAAADVNANATTISGGKITTGSITATQIQASTITADKLSVTSLSAVSANLGTVTINTSGNLASSGTTWGSGTGVFVGWTGSAYGIRAGGTTGQRLVWDGSSLTVQAGNIVIDGNGVSIGTGNQFSGSRINFGGAIMYSNDGLTISIIGQFEAGILSAVDIYASDTLDCANADVQDNIFWHNPPSTTFEDQPVVYSTGNQQLYKKTNGFTGTINHSGGGTTVVSGGIVTGGS